MRHNEKNQTKITTRFLKNCIHEKEVGDARLLARLVGGEFVYDFNNGKWYMFNGHAWELDTSNRLRSKIKNLLTEQYLKIRNEYENADGFYSHLGKLGYKSRLNNVLDLARDYLPFLGQWNSKPYLIAVENGVIDLHTGKLREGKPSDFINIAIPNTYNPDAKAPRFKRFLTEVFDGDNEIADFMQVLLGYGLLGEAKEHVLPILYGPHGFNGKDTLLKAVQKAVGQKLCDQVSSEVLIDASHNASSAKAAYELKGRHICYTSETQDGAILRSDRVKLLTGNARIPVKELYKDVYTIKPKYLLLLLTNFKPRAQAIDDALWERLILIPFEQRFVSHPIFENEHMIDVDLDAKLASEKRGILQWLVEGAVKYHNHGLNIPKTLRLATKEYQRENDKLSSFIEDYCTLDASAEVLQKDFIEAYETITSEKLSSRTFGSVIEKRGFERRKTMHGQAIVGLCLGKPMAVEQKDGELLKLLNEFSE